VSGRRKAPVLAIDGPSGSGKGTVGQLLAARLGWHYLDSGAVYRVLAEAARRAGAAPDDTVLAHLARELDVEFRARPPAAPQVLLGGDDVTDAIRSEACGDLASRIAARADVREALLDLQRRLRRHPGLVADGRDMATTVFPDAVVKIYLTASPEIRAARRYKQLKDKDFDVNLPRLVSEIRERDLRDARREASPLRPAPAAIQLDSSDLTIDEVVERVWRAVQEALPGQQ
jgi:cytidylate kinase